MRNARLPIAVWAASLLVLGAYAVRFSIGTTTHGFIAYYAASRLLLDGQLSPLVYDDPWFMRYVQNITGAGVREIFGPNMPTMAWLAMPVAWLGPSAARTLWLLLSWASLAVASFALIRDAIRRDERPHAIFVALMLLSPAVFANFRFGQAYLFVFAALAGAALCLIREQDVLAGVLIGAVLILKSSGLPLLVLLVVRRRTRAVLSAVAASVAGAAVLLGVAGIAMWRRYVAYVWEFIQRPSTSVTAYQTTRGMLRHLCVADAHSNPFAAANCATAAAIVPNVLLIAAGIITIRAALRARTELWVAAGVCLSVIMVPIAEEHQFVLLGIPLMLVLRGQSRSCWPWIVFAVLFAVPLHYTAYRFTSGWSALAAYPRLYAAWLLWALTIHEVGQTDQLAPAARDDYYSPVPRN